MPLYNTNADALVASDSRTQQFINYQCPYYFEKRACGSWCALFEIAEHTRGSDGSVLKGINLRCGDGNKIFRIIE